MFYFVKKDLLLTNTLLLLLNNILINVFVTHNKSMGRNLMNEFNDRLNYEIWEKGI
jgi:hypothetical protein